MALSVDWPLSPLFFLHSTGISIRERPNSPGKACAILRAEWPARRHRLCLPTTWICATSKKCVKVRTCFRLAARHDTVRTFGDDHPHDHCGVRVWAPGEDVPRLTFSLCPPASRPTECWHCYLDGRADPGLQGPGTRLRVFSEQSPGPARPHRAGTRALRDDRRGFWQRPADVVPPPRARSHWPTTAT